MNRVTVAVLGLFIAILLGSGILAYVLHDQPSTGGKPTAILGASPAPPTPADQSQPSREIPLFGQLFGPDASGLSPSNFSTWEATSARILLRFSLAAFLAALLAFRPRRGVSVVRRNPYVAQTQILMGVVAGAMMMVVGDSAARAFGIFAAASLVRFRTNIRDPKEITVLLVCLGVGLAAGVGRWDMAIILSLFVLLTLAILEYFEESQVFRSMQVSVSTLNTDTTHEVLKRIFKRNRFDIELRELNRPDKDKKMGKIVYVVNMRANVSTDELSDEILSSDADNIDTVEWDQKVSETYMYK